MKRLSRLTWSVGALVGICLANSTISTAAQTTYEMQLEERETLRSRISYCQNLILNARATIEREDRIAATSGYVNKEVKYQAGAQIVDCEAVIKNATPRYAQLGGDATLAADKKYLAQKNQQAKAQAARENAQRAQEQAAREQQEQERREREAAIRKEKAEADRLEAQLRDDFSKLRSRRYSRYDATDLQFVTEELSKAQFSLDNCVQYDPECKANRRNKSDFYRERVEEVTARKARLAEVEREIQTGRQAAKQEADRIVHRWCDSTEEKEKKYCAQAERYAYSLGN